MTEEATSAQTNTDAGTSESEGASTAATGEETQNAGTEKAQGTEESKQAEGGKGKEETPQYHGSPEAFDAYALPEGVEPDEAMTESFSELAKEIDLSQQGAQKLVDYYMGLQQSNATAQVDNLQEAFRNQHETWVTELKQDTDLGGAKYEESMATARQAIERFEKAVPGLKEMLDPWDAETNPNGTGYSNNPVMVRLFHSIGKLISEDSPGSLGGHAVADKASQMYPSMK